MKNHSFDQAQLRSRLKRLVADHFRPDLPDPEKIADHEVLVGGSLGLDSLDALELAMCVEEEFGIAFHSHAESATAFASIASLVGHIQAHGKATPPPVSSQPIAAFILQPSH